MNYQRIYNEIIEKAKPRKLNKKLLDGYFERHHIIPKCLGGNNNKSNLVLLTAREHFICHQLLWKSNKENNKLFLSYWILSNCKKNDSFLNAVCKMTSRQFEKLRIINANIMSEREKGKIYSKETLEKNRIAHIGKKYSTETNAKKGSKGGKNGSAVSCSIDGIKFGCIKDSLNYANEKYEYTLKQTETAFNDPYVRNFIKDKEIKAANGKKVSIDGVVFDSKAKAQYYTKNQYNIGWKETDNRINSDKYPNWFIIKD